MNITEVRIRKIETENRLKAIATIVFENEFAVNDIKILENQDGAFIAMPSRRTQNGEFRDVAHPINAETREKIQKVVLEEYEKIK